MSMRTSASVLPADEPIAPAIAVNGLTKRYGGRCVVSDVSLRIAPGEIFGVLGSNGAGKTTAVEMIQGLRRRDGGVVSVLGHDPATERSALRPIVGSQLQHSALPERLRVGEALRLFARLAPVPVAWREVSERWGLDELHGSAFGALSGGQQQRLFLALALVNTPQVVFLDELTQGLDASARRQTWNLIEKIRAAGTTVVLVTHFMDEAERLCDRVVVLHRGTTRFAGTPGEMIRQHGGDHQITFVAADPALLDGLERHPAVSVVDVGDEVGGDRPGDRGASIRCAPDATLAVMGELDRRGLDGCDLRLIRPSLESAFLALVGAADPIGRAERVSQEVAP